MLPVGRAVRSSGIYFEQLLCRCLWVDFHSVFTFFSEVIAHSEPLVSSYFRRYVAPQFSTNCSQKLQKVQKLVEKFVRTTSYT